MGNDEVVSPFDPNDIEKECFGGLEQVGDGRFVREVNRTRNAYMLIYERKDASEISQTEEEEELEQPKKIEENLQQDNSSKELIMDHSASSSLVKSRKTRENFHVYLPKNLYEMVWQDNMKFLMDQKLFDVEYASFCYDLVQFSQFEENDSYSLLGDDENSERIKVLIEFFLEILLHSKETQLIQKYSETIQKKILARSIPACRWFMGLCSTRLLRSWLLECTEPEPRLAIVNMMNLSMVRVLPLECEQIRDEEEEEEEDEEEDEEFSDVDRECVHLVNNMLNLVYRLPWHWRNFNEYFLFFEIINLIRVGSADGKTAPKMGDKFESPKFGHAIGTLALLIRGSVHINDLSEDDECEENPYALPGGKISLHPEVLRYFRDTTFLKELMDDKNNAAIASIICFFSWESAPQTEAYEKIIRLGLYDAEFENLEGWFTVIRPFVCIEDSYQDHRIEIIFASALEILGEFKKFSKFTHTLITCIFDSYEEIPKVRAWLDKHRLSWIWVEKWLNLRRYRISGLNAGKNLHDYSSYFAQSGGRIGEASPNSDQ